MIFSRNFRYYSFAIVCLLIGTLNYCLFRNDVLFLDFLKANHYRAISLSDSFWSRFLLYQLSDALWALSLMFYASTQGSKLFRVITLILPIVMESTQIFTVIPGVFDINDLVIYILISTLFYVKWKINKEI